MSKKTDRVCQLSIVVVCALAGALYSELPDQITTAWNLSGEPIRENTKPLGVLAFIVIALLPFFIFWIASKLSPSAFPMDRFQRTIDKIKVVLTISFAGCAAVGLLKSAGFDINIVRFIGTILGVLLIVFGNYSGKIVKNILIGIRTPWTLGNDEVWSRTHRLLGRCLLILGICQIYDMVRNPQPSLHWIFVGVFVAVLISVLYSFLLFRKLEGSGNIH